VAITRRAGCLLATTTKGQKARPASGVRIARWRAGPLVAALVTATTVASACSTAKSGTSSAPKASSSASSPQPGGVITVGEFSAVPGLDPALVPGTGTSSGLELAAIYDTLMRYNAQTQQYEPGTAESFPPNADA
jgi:peptide/nickel transport system substrate-binding protein